MRTEGQGDHRHRRRRAASEKHRTAVRGRRREGGGGRHQRGGAKAVAASIGRTRSRSRATSRSAPTIDRAHPRNPRCVRRAHRRRREQCRMDAQEPAALGSRRGDFDKVYAINVKSIFHMIPRDRAADAPAEERRDPQRSAPPPASGLVRAHLVQQLEGAVKPDEKSLAVESARTTSASNASCPVIGETGLLEEFHGMPDTAENRKKIPRDEPARPMSQAARRRARGALPRERRGEFITGVEFPVRRRPDRSDRPHRRGRRSEQDDVRASPRRWRGDRGRG